MGYRMAQIVFLSLALVSALAVFVPLQTLFPISDEQATRCLTVKMLLLPIPVLFLFAANWAARHARRRH